MSDTLGLLNYEGDVLYIVPCNTFNYYFHLYDHYGKLLRTCSRGEVLDIFDGVKTIIDSSGERWDLSKDHEGGKV